MLEIVKEPILDMIFKFIKLLLSRKGEKKLNLSFNVFTVNKDFSNRES